MPIRSSVCAYSPLAAAGSSSSSKYSSPGATGRYSSSSFLSSSVLPNGALTHGHYKPLGATTSGYTSRFASSSGNSASSSSSPGALSVSSATRYGSSSYSPSTASSSSSSSSAASSAASSASSTGSLGLYRPLTTSSAGGQRGSFNAATRPASAYTPTSSRYSSVSNSSISSASSDYLSPSLTGAPRSYANQSSSAYSSASLSSSSSLASGRHFGSSAGRARRQSYTPLDEPLPEGVPNGLTNLGNTCYMNAALQALYAIDSFRNLLISNRRGQLVDTSKSLTSELSDLFNKMKSSSVHRTSPTSLSSATSTSSASSSASSSSSSAAFSSLSSSSSSLSAISPANFKQAFSRYQNKFAGLDQQDAQEFLRYLINGIHEESNQVNKTRAHRCSPSSAAPSPPKTSDDAWAQYRARVDDSPFVDLLVGQLCSKISCTQCNNKSYCWDPFWDLSLPLVGARARYECSLLDLLNEFTAKETLDSDERPMCERCKKATKSTKQISLSKLPQVLILHLKKFTNDGYKLSSPDVRIETELRFHDNQVVYQLKACISHHGHSSSSGHYTSHCEYSTKWFQFDDHRVRDVSASFSGSKLDDAYVLFYTRQARSSSTYL